MLKVADATEECLKDKARSLNVFDVFVQLECQDGESRSDCNGSNGGPSRLLSLD